MRLSINTLADIMAGWKGRMPRWADEIRKMGVTDVAFFSQLTGKTIVDSKGAKLGKLDDLLVIPGERFLEVSGIVYRSMLYRRFIIPWQWIEDISEIVKLNVLGERIPPGEQRPGEISLKEVVLDKQIVDTDGLKVVRVNDVLLAQIGGHISVIGVDTGMKGMLRRLGVLRLLSPILPVIHEHIIPWAYIEPLQPELRSLQLKVPRHRISDMHPADIADIIEELNNRQRVAILKSLDDEKAAEALEESDIDVQVSVVKCLNKEKMAHILENMYADEAADLLRMLSREKASELLSLMEQSEAREVKDLLKYPERSAGGVMRPDYITINENARVKDAIAEISRRREDVEAVYYIYVTDDRGRLVGVISLKDLIIAGHDEPVSRIVSRDIGKVTDDTPVEEVANLMAKYDLLSIPVVDASDTLKGIIAIDDIIDLMIPTRWKHHLPKTFPRRAERGATT